MFTAKLYLLFSEHETPLIFKKSLKMTGLSGHLYLVINLVDICLLQKTS